jgi:peptidoglycan hydrolase-like protein with peptidoglycan-binding domain
MAPVVRGDVLASARMRALCTFFCVVALGSGAVAASAAADHRPAGGALALAAHEVDGPLLAVTSGVRWSVSGVLTHYVRGQRIVIHAFDDGRLLLSQPAALHRHGHSATFTVALRVVGVGRVTVRAIHYATRAQAWIVSPSLSVWVVAPTIAPGERGLAVRILQAKLAALHYVIGAAGVFDARTQRAVLAFRKMAGLPLTMVAGASVFAALDAGKGVFTVRYPAQGRHVEGDLTHQVLALIGADGEVEALYPMSSGKPTTPTTPGTFTVYEKQFGTNSDGMVDSSYFNGGDAIHGYYEVPPYAASHGCLRVPIPDAPTIYDWVALGTTVDVYFR